MEFKLVNSEEPDKHWEFVSVLGQRVLDLGCGDFGRISSLPYPSTVEYFLIKGASYVVGIDSLDPDVNAIIDNLKDYENKFSIQTANIQDSSILIDLIKNNDIDIVKCDIEGAEIHLLNISDDIFSNVEQYYIETHDDNLYNMTVDKLVRCGYEIYNKIDLTHAPGCLVIFAKKI